MRKSLPLFLLFIAAIAQAAETTVTGTITDPAGDLVSGSCTIQAVEPFSATNGWRVVGAPTTVYFSGGAFSASLVPTDTATPAGQYYKVTCAVPRQTISGRLISGYSWGPVYWLVPTSATSLDISAVEISSPPAAPYMLSPVQISASGLATGVYCLNVMNGAVTGLVACTSGSSGSNPHWSTVTSSSWATMTSGSWATMTN
jgi:hypothetical protein